LTRALGRAVALDLQAGAQTLDELVGRRDPEVCGQQGVLDLLPVVLAELIARQQRQQATTEHRL
jgi:hypothetical protein